MNILLLGGTGAMGIHLVQILQSDKGNNIVVTSRSKHEDRDNVIYKQGNAHNLSFLNSVLNNMKWNAIFDFMIYSPSEFEHRIDSLLSQTKQYFFFSSARVFAGNQEKLTEDSNRLLDYSTDSDYLNTDEYALNKALEENLLKESKYKNWTIIRPYITFSKSRLQLGILEKERWLYRALHGRTIIFSKDIATRLTTLTYGYDVSKCVAELIGNKNSLCETYNVTTSECHTWQEILNIYIDVIRKRTKREPKVIYTDYYSGLYGMTYQVKYDRLFNRTFDNTKIRQFLPKIAFCVASDKVKECINSFLDDPSFLPIDWAEQAFYDKIAKEKTSLYEIKSIKNKIIYLRFRYFKHYMK